MASARGSVLACVMLDALHPVRRARGLLACLALALLTVAGLGCTGPEPEPLEVTYYFLPG